MATYTDNFDGRGSLGANWTVSGGFPGVSGDKVSFPASQFHVAYWNGTVGTTNMFSEADVVGGGAAGNDGSTPATCIADANNLYYAWVSNEGAGPIVSLWVINGGGYTQIATNVPIASTTCRCRLETEGTTHRVYVDSVLKITVVNSARTGAGHPGFIGYTTGSAITLDNWAGGDFTPAAVPYAGAAPFLVGQDAPTIRSHNW